MEFNTGKIPLPFRVGMFIGKAAKNAEKAFYDFVLGLSEGREIYDPEDWGQDYVNPGDPERKPLLAEGSLREFQGKKEWVLDIDDVSVLESEFLYTLLSSISVQTGMPIDHIVLRHAEEKDDDCYLCSLEDRVTFKHLSYNLETVIVDDPSGRRYVEHILSKA